MQMILSRDELNRLSFLLGKYRLDHLATSEEEEVRVLVAKEMGRSLPEPIKHICQIGLIIVGIDKLSEDLEKLKTLIKSE